MMPAPHVLVVDDEREACQGLGLVLQDEGYRVTMTYDGHSALALAKEDEPDVALLDLRMPGMDGLALLAALRDNFPAVSAIMMTAYGSEKTAVEAMKRGAKDYLTKPVDMDELLLCIERLIEHNRLLDENRDLRDQLRERYSFDNMIGGHPQMQRVFKAIAQMAETDATVLITGETGTGKELVAQALHNLSNRSSAPFVVVNCAALSEGILESELFGHEKGAFTGAERRRIGRFERAHKGTLLLDEITEIGPNVQVKLLRFLEDHRVERVGGEGHVEVDVRILAATNRDIEDAVAKGIVRNDLYYRLNVVQLTIPPLRERLSDIPLLCQHFLLQYRGESDLGPKAFSPEAIKILTGYEWPGNVRELRNVVEQTVVFCREAVIQPHHLPAVLREVEPIEPKLRPGDLEGVSLAEIEREAILSTLQSVSGDRSRAAQLLGISERTLYRKLSEYRTKANAIVRPGSKR
jgi:two-component system response regulator HydG